MSKENLLFSLIQRELEINPDKITKESSFKDLGLDSLDMAELTMTIEDTFDVEISDADAMEMLTVGDVLKYI